MAKNQSRSRSEPGSLAKPQVDSPADTTDRGEPSTPPLPVNFGLGQGPPRVQRHQRHQRHQCFPLQLLKSDPERIEFAGLAGSGSSLTPAPRPRSRGRRQLPPEPSRRPRSHSSTPTFFAQDVLDDPFESTIPEITAQDLDDSEATTSSLRRRITAIDLRKMAANNNATYSPIENAGAGNRGASPAPSSVSQVNGNGMNASYMTPPAVGQQQDLNFLYGQIQELSTLLAENRGRVTGLTQQAEQIADRVTNGTLTNGQVNPEASVARIHDLEVKLARANKVIELYKHEQSENTKLLAEYEESMGDATDKIRNYCCDNEERYLALRKHYNNLLQQEKDEHLQSRLERDDWHAKCMRVCEMIRTAHRLRNEEDHEAIYVVARLQAEVRIYRRCLGMDQERPEAEAGWAYLRTAQSSAGSTEET